MIWGIPTLSGLLRVWRRSSVIAHIDPKLFELLSSLHGVIVTWSYIFWIMYNVSERRQFICLNLPPFLSFRATMATAPYNYSYIFKYIIIGKWAAPRVSASHADELAGAAEIVWYIWLQRQAGLYGFSTVWMLPYTLGRSSTFKDMCYRVYTVILKHFNKCENKINILICH